LEFFPKSVRRREKGRVAWFRHAFLKWYLPLFEPRHIPPEDERDPALAAREGGAEHKRNCDATVPMP
jgi:hypothetical protein